MEINRLFHQFSVKISSIFCGLTRHLRAIVTALILPFLSTASRTQWENPRIQSQELEGKQAIGAMNRAQQAYYTEYNAFTDSLPKLGLDLPTKTANYNYSIRQENQAVFHYAISLKPHLKSFVGGVFFVDNTIQAILCEANVSGRAIPLNPTHENGILACGDNTVEVSDLPPETEAKEYVRRMNRAQEAYYSETANFLDSVEELRINMRPSTTDYSYSIRRSEQAVFNYGISQQPHLKSFVGGVFLVNGMPLTIVCEAKVAGPETPANPTNQNGILACGYHTEEVSFLPLTEAKLFVESMNKAQQAYYAENGTFTDSVEKLGIGIRVKTPNYNYSIFLSDRAVFNYGISRKPELKSYVGAVFLEGDESSEYYTNKILCVAKVGGPIKPAKPTNKNGVIACGDETVVVTP